MKIRITLFILNYANDTINLLMNQHHNQFSLIQKPIDDDPTRKIKTTLKNFKIDLNDQQITLLSPTYDQNCLTIPSFIKLTLKQNVVLNDYLNHHQDYYLMDLNHLVNISDTELKVIKNYQIELTNDFKLHQLASLKFWLPREFTTYYLTSLINLVNDHQIKPNNIKRYYQKDLKFIRKDHSHRGNPKNIFSYQNKKA